MDDLKDIFTLQTKNRWNVSASSADERKKKLKRLKTIILKRREDIKIALYNDFKKSPAETELTEIHPVLDEINFAIKHLNCWLKPKRVRTPIALFGARSKIKFESKGVVLILSPWNYPFSLMINPIVAAVAAGNCIMARPSEKTPHTGVILKEIIKEVFSRDEVALILGEIDVAEKLLELPFDHIFFTGSINVGKKVMAAASKNLATVTLELGGKSPVIIDRDIDLEDAVTKIAWGKFINAGQTCVAPDYLFVPEEIKDKVIDLLKKEIFKFYGETINDRKKSDDYARLIDKVSFVRLVKKIENEKNILEDTSFLDQNYLPPTVIETNLNSPIMEDEIFGPILPLISYKDLDEVIHYIQSHSNPLALYIFSKQKKIIKKILNATSSGGVAINHVVLHLANPYLPFGGVGHSGQGSYHGYYGFKAFSHERSILIQGKFTLSKIFFPPYNGIMSKLAFRLLRLLE